MHTRHRLLLPVLVLLASVALRAQAQLPLPQMQRAVELHAQALAWQAAQAPAVLLYVAAPQLKPELRLVEVFIDRDRVQAYQFSARQAEALRQGLRQQLVLPGLAAGQHALRIHVVAREPDSQSRQAAVDEVLTQSLDLDAGGAVLEVVLRESGQFAGPRLQLRTLADAPAQAEAQRRYADFLAAGGEAFAAASQRQWLGMHAAPLAEMPAPETAVLPYQQALQALASAQPVIQAQLEALAQAPVQTELALALRDALNLQLAYRDLQAQQAASAIARLQRIRSPGPCDNAALLALGWAYLLPRGKLPDASVDADADAEANANADAEARAAAPSLHPGSADAIAQARRRTPFRYRQAVAAGERGEDIARALVPWEELIGRDPLDPAVQEGMLALPYALDHAGAHAQAQQYYQRAITQLQALRQRLQDADAQLRSGELLALLDARDADEHSGWSRLLVDRRDDREQVPLRLLRRDATLAALLQAHREQAIVRHALQQDIARLAAARDATAAELQAQIAQLEAQLQAQQAAQDAQLVAQAQARLQQIDAQAQQYLAEAHFALARQDDQVPGAPPFGASP